MARKSRKNIDTAVIETFDAPSLCKAAGYIRLSVEDNRNKGDSVETQKAILQSFIALTPGIKLHDFYIDNGISGQTFERPAFRRMLADAENGVINCIVVKDLSRFGRNAIDTGYYIEKYLPSLRCRFISVNDNFDTEDMDNGASVILPIMNVINEAAARDIGRKVKAQIQQSMKAGEYNGPRPPYGYLKAPDNCHKLIVDPIAAPIVRRIFEMFAENVSIINIVRHLNETGIPTPTHHHKEIGLIKNNRQLGTGVWQTFTVNHIIGNEVYIGNMVQGKTRAVSRKKSSVNENEWIRVENTHEALISREVYGKTQERLTHMAQKAVVKKERTKPFTPNIFKGKVFCGHCGSGLQRTRGWMRQGERVYVFTCWANKQKARNSCLTYHMPEEDLIKALLTTIQAHTDVVVGKSLKLRKNSVELDAKREAVASEIAALRLDADKSGRMFKSLYESLVSDLITKDEYRKMRDSYEAKARESLARAADLETRQAELDRQIAEYCEFSDLLAGSANSGITEKIIDCLVDGIKVFSDRSIEVDFCFGNKFGLISEVNVGG